MADCVAAMRAAVPVPVTVKCRIGRGRSGSGSEPVRALIDAVRGGRRDGLRSCMRARRGWRACRPKENRDVPPLDYDLVYRVKREHPELTIVINGGIATLDEAEAHLAHVDGVMLGRAAYHDPAIADAGGPRAISARRRRTSARSSAVRPIMPYVERNSRGGVRLAAMTRHMLGLFHGQRGARAWRRILTVDLIKAGRWTRSDRTRPDPG